VVNQIKYQGKSLAGASLKGYKVTHKNSVIYTKSPLKNQPYGIIKTNKESSGIVSALYAVYTTKENVLADFIQVYFSSDNRLNDYLRPIVNKGAKNTLLVSDEGALSGMVVFPSDIKEQIYIANFFSCLHTLITAQEQKAYKLRCLKKSFLEKMFITDK
jgi:type I restriction enzyme S subunit